jgi:hypothetical protein
MMIQIELTPESIKTIADLGGMSSAVLDGVSKGLLKGASIAAGNVASNYLSGQALKSRSGMLAKAVDGILVKPLEASVGVHKRSDAFVHKYAWLLTDEEKTITPKKGNALTIPIGEALTGSGVPKYESVANAERELGVKLFRLPGRNILGYKRGKKGKFRALFVLVKSVFIQGSGALYDGVLESVDKGDINDAIDNEIDKITG